MPSTLEKKRLGRGQGLLRQWEEAGMRWDCNRLAAGGCSETVTFGNGLKEVNFVFPTGGPDSSQRVIYI